MYKIYQTFFELLHNLFREKGQQRTIKVKDETKADNKDEILINVMNLGWKSFVLKRHC